MVTFMLGADPEVFVTKKGQAISAHGLIEGTKRSPQRTSLGGAQVDGTALEFNIDPVEASNFEKFNLNVVRTLKDLKELAKDVNFSKVSVQDFDPEYLKSLPEEALELGCDPDFNAYTGQKNPTPDGTRSFRTGAGHVHIGWGADIPVSNEEHVEICRGFIKMLDATVGAFMTYIDREPRRRELYGKAGAFRPKPYGAEYRTPSNAWIWNRSRRTVMHAMINYAISRHTGGYEPRQIAGLADEQAVVDMINSGNHVIAQQVVYRCLPHMNEARRCFDDIVAEFEKADKKEVAA